PVRGKHFAVCDGKSDDRGRRVGARRIDACFHGALWSYLCGRPHFATHAADSYDLGDRVGHRDRPDVPGSGPSALRAFARRSQLSCRLAALLASVHPASVRALRCPAEIGLVCKRAYLAEAMRQSKTLERHFLRRHLEARKSVQTRVAMNRTPQPRTAT